MAETYIAVIPAYEPGAGFPLLVKAICASGMTAVVVDDGSGAEYRGIFENVSKMAKVLVHDKNLGKGIALKTAFEYIRNNYPENAVIVTMDCDGQHTPEDALKICKEAEKNPGMLVLGSRRQGKDSPLRSRFGNKITRFVFRISSGVKLHDTQTGLRAFHASLLTELIAVEGARYEYEMNALLTLAKKKIPMIEIPIETIYLDNNRGSHFDPLKDSVCIYKNILKFSASSFIGFLTDYALFSLLSVITAFMPGSSGLVFSNICARIVSAGVNFTINRLYVFKSKKNVFVAAFQYFLLAACILAGNTLLLNFLVSGAGWNRYAAKIVTEITFFTLSFIVQHFIIFRKKEQTAS